MALPVFSNRSLSLSITATSIHKLERSASGTLFAAVGRKSGRIAHFAFMYKMSFSYTNINNIPRQNFIKAAFTGSVELGAQSILIHSIHPALESEIIRPCFKAAAVAPYILNNSTKSSVST